MRKFQLDGTQIVSILLGTGGAAISAFAPSVLPENWHSYVLYGGISLVTVAVFIFFFHKPKTISPDLVIKPKKHDTLVKFDSASILPNESPHSPFLIQIQNIGEEDIVNVTIRFEVVGLDLQELLNDTTIFPFVEPDEQGGMIITTKRDKNGKDMEYININLITTGERIINLLPAHGQPEELDMPATIKNALALFMFASSYDIHTRIFDKVSAKILSANDKKEWLEIHKIQAEESALRMPDIAMNFSWFSADQEKIHKSVLLKSIYFAHGGNRWVIDINSSESFFIGMSGIFSMENLNEPEQGLYNLLKKKEV